MQMLTTIFQNFRHYFIYSCLFTVSCTIYITLCVSLQVGSLGCSSPSLSTTLSSFSSLSTFISFSLLFQFRVSLNNFFQIFPISVKSCSICCSLSLTPLILDVSLWLNNFVELFQFVGTSVLLYLFQFLVLYIKFALFSAILYSFLSYSVFVFNYFVLVACFLILASSHS